MADPRPRKRQRRMIVESSDDNADESFINASAERERDNTKGNENANEQTDAGSPRRKGVVRSGTTAAAMTTTRTTRLSGGKVQMRLDVDGQLSPSRTGTRTGSRTAGIRASTRSATTARTPTPSSSPEKLRNGKTRAKNVNANAGVRAFFKPASDEQRWDRNRGPDREPRTVNSSGGGSKGGIGIGVGTGASGFGWEDDDDSIEDDGVDEIFAGMLGRNMKAKTGNGNGDYVEKRDLGSKSKMGKTNGKTIRPGKKFLLPTSHRPPGFGAANGVGGVSSSASSSLSTTQSGGSAKPWPEEFAPASLEELAVHKRKVADVQSWLADVFSGKSRRRILVLRGPAGSGKTTTVTLLSKALGYDIVEWKNSAGSEYASQGYVSMGAQFDDFLGRSDKFNTLDLDGQQENPLSQAPTGDSDTQRRVILVEEFPTSLAPGSSGLLAFRAALQRYLAAAVPPLGINERLRKTDPSLSPPIIIVVSETLLGTGSSFADNFTVHRLLGPEISNHPGVSIIEFNPIAPTFISKALDLVLKKEARRSNRKRIPGPAVLKQISEMGDIRSAISSLEFLCLRSGDPNGAGWSGTLTTQKKRTGKKDVPATAMEKESLEMVTQREASLGIFHAVGKVMYNKREDPAISGTEPAAQPPAHLREHARPKVSQVSTDDLINETGTDIQTFISALHENYVLSCNGPSFTDTLENSISTLSDADIVAPDSRRGYRISRAGVGSARPSFQSHGGSGNIDVLRQEEISFQTAVRGLLFSLPYPVKRASVPGSRRGDEHKMFYPTSLRLWRENEEVEGLLDLWIRKLTDPHANTSKRNIRPRGVESWRNRFAMSMPGTGGHDEGDTASSAAPRAMLSRDEVLLERLPYLNRISKDLAELQQLEKLVKFHGIVGQSDDPDPGDEGLDDDDGNVGVETWATDRTPVTPQKRQMGERRGGGNVNGVDGMLGSTATEMVEDAVDKLVLSDDDIED